MHSILTSIAEGRTLSRADAERAMNILLEGTASSVEIAGFLLGLRSRGETIDELVGLTHAMREHAVPVSLPTEEALDIVGTGGDRSGTFNISTACAFVCAGAGVIVAKHGNKSVSSRSGSSDCLEKLGVQTNLGKAGVEYCLRQTGMAFIFAPLFHPALKHVMPVRKGLGVRTCFNILGPMCNPAGVRRYLIGAFSEDVAEAMAEILVTLGATHVIAVHAHDGLDEISLSGPTTVFTRFPGYEATRKTSISPFDYGMTPAPLESVIGGDAAANAQIVRDVLGAKTGAPRDIVTLNSGFALYAAGKVSTVVEGIAAAVESIVSGAAMDRLERLIDASHEAPAE